MLRNLNKFLGIFYKNKLKHIDKINNKKYNGNNMLSRVDERIGSMTPQQPIK